MPDIDMVATIRDIVRAHSRNGVTEIRDRDILASDLGFDSLAFLLTLSELEERLRFRFPLEDVDRLRDISVGDLVRLVAAQSFGRRATTDGETLEV